MGCGALFYWWPCLSKILCWTWKISITTYSGGRFHTAHWLYLLNLEFNNSPLFIALFDIESIDFEVKNMSTGIDRQLTLLWCVKPTQSVWVMIVTIQVASWRQWDTAFKVHILTSRGP